ncbi:hypothetical protein LCGC14_1214130 [marine sediment metagenome]|uniref:Uncharacterized protein n=1 Tax=marine sediment metagenome TaxID=412755 RepID=A0A0F9M0L5_9ZZZZ
MPNNPLVDSFELISSDKDTHFTDAITKLGGFEEEDIAFPAEWGLIQSNKCEVLNVSIQSDQPLDLEVLFFATDAHADTDLDKDRAITSLFFAGTDAKRTGNPLTGQYRYNLDPATFPFTYHDEDNSSQFHITLINRDATDKIAGATGEIVLTIHAVPIM